PFCIPQSGKQFAPLDFLPDNFSKKGAPAALADQRIHLGKQIFRQDDVSAFVPNRHTFSVTELRESSKRPVCPGYPISLQRLRLQPYLGFSGPLLLHVLPYPRLPAPARRRIAPRERQRRDI